MDKSHLKYERIGMCNNDSLDMYALMKFKEAIDLKLKKLKATKQKALEEQPIFPNVGFHLDIDNQEI